MRSRQRTGGWLLLALVLGLCPSARAAGRIRARVVEVVEGDTLVVRPRGEQTTHRIQIHGIACPLPSQPDGERAHRFTRRLVKGKVVAVERIAEGVARVRLGGRDLAELLLRAGWAWWHPEQAAENKRYQRLAARAKRAQRGLWAAKSEPIPPWDFAKHDIASCTVACAKGKGDQRCRLACAGKRAPRLPADRTRSCKRDDDCVFHPEKFCACSPCGRMWRTAVNRAHHDRLYQRWSMTRCKMGRCPPCSRFTEWLGSTVRCEKGQCVVR